MIGLSRNRRSQSPKYAIAALLAGILIKHSVVATSTVTFSFVFLQEFMCFIGIATTLNFLDKQYMKIAARNETEVNHCGVIADPQMQHERLLMRIDLFVWG